MSKKEKFHGPFLHLDKEALKLTLTVFGLINYENRFSPINVPTHENMYT